MLSPSTASLDRVKKLATYTREQVAHAWLIDPVAGTLDVLRLDGGRWTMNDSRDARGLRGRGGRTFRRD